jgi:DNA polymerase-1
VIVGEAPGAQEEKFKIPFIGESGQLLRSALTDAGFVVSEATFTNVCRCRPPENEEPKKKAQELCTKLFLFNELKDLAPKLVVLAGAPALNTFFPNDKITSRSGEFMEARGMVFLPVVHPAYCLRNPPATAGFRKDLKKAYRYMNNERADDKNYIVVDTLELLEQARTDLITNAPDFLAFDVETNEMLDIYDPKMVLWTIGFGTPDGKNYSIPLDHPENNNMDFKEKCWVLFRDVMANKSKKIAHNADFDLRVMIKFKIAYKNFFADTMVMVFLMDENRYYLKLKDLASEFLDGCMYGLHRDMRKLCLHNCEDVSNTIGIFKIFEAKLREFPKLWDLFEKILMPMVEVIAEMELEGVLMDVKASSDLAKDLHKKLDAVYEIIADTVPESKDVNLGSPKQLGDLMFITLKYPESRTTPNGQFSTDNEVLENLSRKKFKLATYILKIRKYEKMLSTYVEKFPKMIRDDGRVHGRINLCGTKTGRTSSSEPNLQNIDTDKRVKGMFIASPGCVLMQADGSQMELRVGCSIADETTMIKAYQQDRDLHRLTASNALKIPENKITKEQRQMGKPINFGFIYGATPEAFQFIAKADYGLILSLKECTDFRNAFFKTYPGFLSWYERTINLVREQGYIEYPTGRFCRFPAVKGEKEIPDDIFRKAVNYPVQGSSSDIVLFTMGRIRRVIQKYKLPIKMILTVHDSVVFDGPKDDILSTIPYEMNSICVNDMPKYFPWLRVPMKFDYAIGPNWGELEEMKKM